MFVNVLRNRVAVAEDLAISVVKKGILLVNVQKKTVKIVIADIPVADMVAGNLAISVVKKDILLVNVQKKVADMVVENLAISVAKKDILLVNVRKMRMKLQEKMVDMVVDQGNLIIVVHHDLIRTNLVHVRFLFCYCYFIFY
jgi:hypothetical protein